MDAGFDSSGGAQTDGFHNTNQESPFSKDGIMFKLMGSEAHRQNGDEDGAAVDPFFCPKPLNGNSQTFSHQMEEDDDFGPETDVDAVDDAISSPSAPEKNMFASENLLSSNAPKFDHELVKPEMDPFAQDDQMVDPFARDNHFERDTFEQFEHAAHFEHAGSPDLLHAAHEDNQLAQHHAINELDQFMRQDSERHDASTPPIDAVLEINASLADNVAESGGEESEDEWNYFKGDKAEPAGAAAAQETQLSDECQEIKNIEAESVDEDAMSSPLNPDAAPFVPVSPTRAEPTGLPAHLLADPIIAGSPHKPLSMDNVTVPEPSEFDTEIASRLSDLDYLNGHSDNSALSSQENLKETLHGNEKQHSGFECGDDDIADCQISPAGDMVNPAEFDRVQKDTTGDFCDIQVAYNQHANQPFDDEGIDEELYERLKNKERDPMSMSFYQEKDEDTCETGGHNPFDLNAVQTIPNDSDEEITNERQPDNSIQAMLSGINPFMDKNPEVTSIEINAAISDLDKAVTNEDDSMDHKDFKPLEFDNESVENNIHSPMSDNVSQLTEPSEAGEAEQQELTSPLEVEPAAISQDSALSPEPASPMEGDGDICQISNSVTLESQPIQMDSHLLEQMTDLHVAASPEPVAHEFEPAQSPEPVAMSPSPVPDTMVPSAETNIMAEPSQPQHFDSFGTEQMQDQFSNEAEFKIDSFDQPPNEYSLPKSPRDEQTDKNLDFGFSPDVPAEAPFTNNDILMNFQQPIQQVNEFVESTVVENVQNANDFIPEEISKSFEQNFSEPIQQQSENMLNETELKYDRLLDTVTSLESKFENMSENICEKLPEPSESHFTEISHNNVEPEQYNLMESQKENDAVCNMFDKPVETISAVRDEITDIISAAATEVHDSQIKTESLQQDLVNVDPIQLIAEMKQDEPKENKLNVDLVTPLAVAAVTGVAAAAATAVAAADKKTPLKSTTKTTTTTKKATPLKATSPTKPTAPKVAATTAARKPATPTARTTASPAAAKPAAPKPAVKAATATSPTKPAPKAAAPAPRPKTAPVKAPVADKKPLTNGEVKREPIKKPLTSSVAAKTTSAPKPAPSTTVKSTVSSAAPKPARPATAPARPPTARPATTAAATARAAAPTKTTAAPRPKPATTTATRAPISRPAATKPAAPADKLSKDTANKQISAARPTPAPRATLTNKTSDIKTTSKTTTKTTTTTAPAKPSNPPPIRRPTGTAVKSTTTATTKTATKTTTKAVTKGTSEKMNGSKEQTEICMNGSALITDIPLKDNSPQQVDNSLLPVIDAAAD